MTGNELVNAALTIIGVLSQGETPSGSESAQGLVAANNLLQSWGTERLNVFTIATNVFNLTTSVQSYTIGPAGTFAMVRPNRYQSAQVLVPSAAGGGDLAFPLQIVDQAGYAEINEKTLSGNVCKVMYADMAFPLTTLYFWPRPLFATGQIKVQLGTWVPLTEFADLITNYSYPPGYDRALKYNLAMELAPSFGMVPTPATMQIAAESKAAIRMLNGAEPGGVPLSGQVNAIAQQGQ